MGDDAAQRDLALEAPIPLSRRLMAEFLGTLLLVAVGTGAATVLGLGPALGLADIETLLAGAPGQDQIFRALLSNSLGDTLGVAFAFATVLALLVHAFGGISGGHFNPAITAGLAVVRRFSWGEVIPYWVVQVLGGVVGALIIAGIYRENGAAIAGTDILYGATRVAPGINELSAILSEFFVTFVWMTAVMAFGVDRRVPKGAAGFGIGLALAGGIIVTASATGGSANFARSFGPFAATWVTGEFLNFSYDSIPWNDLIVYALGPLLGGAVAALLYESVVGLEPVPEAPKEVPAREQPEPRYERATDETGEPLGEASASDKPDEATTPWPRRRFDEEP